MVNYSTLLSIYNVNTYHGTFPKLRVSMGWREKTFALSSTLKSPRGSTIRVEPLPWQKLTLPRKFGKGTAHVCWEWLPSWVGCGVTLFIRVRIQWSTVAFPNFVCQFIYFSNMPIFNDPSIATFYVLLDINKRVLPWQRLTPPRKFGKGTVPIAQSFANLYRKTELLLINLVILPSTCFQALWIPNYSQHL